jgi:hypothetical protein
MFDVRSEPCFQCGRELDECACGLAPDIPDQETERLVGEDDDFYSDWSIEEDSDDQDYRDPH